MILIGIDIGASGAACAYDSKSKTMEVLRFAKATEADISAFFARNCKADCAYIERVHSSPQMGVKSAFSFGYAKGLIYGMITAFCIPFVEVTPLGWQKSLGIKKRDKATESTIDHKRKLKQAAQRLYPNETITNDKADAILIMHYGLLRRM